MLYLNDTHADPAIQILSLFVSAPHTLDTARQYGQGPCLPERTHAELQSVCLPITEQHRFSEAIQDIFMRSCVGTGRIILQILYTPETDESVGEGHCPFHES